MSTPVLAQNAGGMMEAFAAADPAVQSGLLVYEVRPWYVAMEHL